VVYQDLEPQSHKTKEMALHLASSFPESRKFLLVDHVSQEGPDSTNSTASADSADSSVSAGSAMGEAAGGTREVSSGGEGGDHAKGVGREAAEGDSVSVSEPPATPQSQSQSQSQSEAEGEGRWRRRVL